LDDGVAFINKEVKASTKIKTKRNKDHITCYKCNETGQNSNECPNEMKADDEKQFLTNVMRMINIMGMMMKMTTAIVTSPIYYVRNHSVLCKTLDLAI